MVSSQSLWAGCDVYGIVDSNGDLGFPPILSFPRLQVQLRRTCEELAYAAQDKWLNLFGRNLSTGFQIG
jgi:hypothetical protein